MTVPDVPLAVNPFPVHEVAFAEEYVSIEVWPALIEVGLAARLAVSGGGGGGGFGETVTVVFADAEPPAPMQVIEYVVVAEGITLTDPDVAFVVKPLPAPVHKVAFVEEYVSVVD